MVSFLVNAAEWAKLPKTYQAAFETAAAEANVTMLAEYDAKNPAALGRLLQNGVKLFRYPNDLMAAAQKEAFALYEDEAAKNPAFKKLYEPWKKFRAQQQAWFNTCEQAMEDFMYANRVK